jgi:hypothetical protein
MALGLAHGPRLGRDVEAGSVAGVADHELRAAAADVDHERLRASISAGCRRTEECEPSLLVAADRARVDAEALAQRGAELFAVGTVTHRARGHGDHLARPVPVDQLAVLGQGCEDTFHRVLGEPPARVHPLAEAGDLGAPHELMDAPVVHVRHEQAGRVRAEVHDGDRIAHRRHPRAAPEP